jgi:hypothetical protein
MGIEFYSSTAANNSSAPPMGWPEGMAPSAVNDTGRQMMADIRAWYEAAEWIDFGYSHAYVSGTQFTIAGGIDRTATYHPGRRIRAQGAGAGTIYGTVSASGYSAPTTTVTVAWDSGALQNESLAIALHIISGNATAIPAVLARSGTKLVFPGIASAPAGWSIDTTAAYDQATIRVRNAASAATGGSVDFTAVFANGNTGAYTLQIADLPAHTHDLGNHTHGMAHTHTYSKSFYNNTGGVAGANINPNAGEADGAAATSNSSISSTGAPSSNSSGSAGGGAGHGHGLTLAVKYIDSCICVKI